jgi:hypothetical protein
MSSIEYEGRTYIREGARIGKRFLYGRRFARFIEIIDGTIVGYNADCHCWLIKCNNGNYHAVTENFLFMFEHYKLDVKTVWALAVLGYANDKFNYYEFARNGYRLPEIEEAENNV